MTRFTTVDQAILEKTKVSKILPRFVKKGGDVTRKLAQQILDNVAVATKRKSEEKKDSKPTKPTSTVSATSTARNGKVATVKSVQMARQPPQPAGSKRERDPEEEILPTPKGVLNRLQNASICQALASAAGSLTLGRLVKQLPLPLLPLSLALLLPCRSQSHLLVYLAA